MCYSDAYINRNDTLEGEKEGSLPKTIRRIERSLANVWNEFDVIVVSGLSGIIPGAILAHQHGKQLVVIRKDEEITHGVRTEGKEYFAPGTPYIVIDDMISTGTTMRRIFDKMEELDYGLPSYLVLYHGTWWTLRVEGMECGYLNARFINAHHIGNGLYIPFAKEKAA